MNEPGINIKRTIGAALNEFTGNAIYGQTTGASTLEQQLVKNLTKDDDVGGIDGYLRKVREIFRAIGLCNRYSKATILEAYLNTISLTGQIYGMEVGAQTYFGKKVSDLTLSLSTRCLSCAGKSVRLGFKEFDVLRLLMSAPKAVIPKEDIISKVWGIESDAEDNNVEVYISFLRKKLHFLGTRVSIGTVRKVGYHLEFPLS